MNNRIVLSVLALSAAVSVAAAQGNPPRQPQRQGRMGQPQPDSMARSRAQLEGQVNNRIGQMARQRLGLNDAQVEKLQQTNRKFADRRRTLLEQERDIRFSLREEMIGGDSSRQKQVGELMDRMVKAQRQRIDLLEQEQKELATFLTPMQRATYFGLEEQLRQRLNQMRQDGGPGGNGGPGGGRVGQGGRGGRMRPNGPPPDGEPGMPMGGPPPGGARRVRPMCTPPNCPPPDVP